MFTRKEILNIKERTPCGTLCFHQMGLAVSVGEAGGISRWLFVTPRSARFFVRRVIPVQSACKRILFSPCSNNERTARSVVNVRFKCHECKCESGEFTSASTATRSFNCQSVELSYL